MPIPVRPAPGPERYAARWTLAVCAAAALLEGFDNQSMGVAAPAVFREIRVSAAQAGFLFSAATFGLLLGAAVGGRVADRFGRRATLNVSLLLFGVCSLLTANSVGLTALVVARFLTGLGCGGAMPNFIALATESVARHRRLATVTLVMAALPFGGGLAGLMSLGGSLGWGWRSIFVVGGIAPILLAIAALAIGRAPPDPQPAAARPALEAVGTVLWGMGRARTTACLWTGFLCTQLVLFLMVNWLPSLVIGLGFSRPQASIASITFNFAGSLGAAFLGRLHAGARRRLWVAVTYGGIALSLLLLVAVAAARQAFGAAVLACAVSGLFIIGAQLILFALAPLFYASASRGTGVGAAVAVGRLGSVIGPLYAGALLSAGGATGAVLLGIIPFVGIAGTAAFLLAGRPQSDA